MAGTPPCAWEMEAELSLFKDSLGHMVSSEPAWVPEDLFLKVELMPPAPGASGLTFMYPLHTQQSIAPQLGVRSCELSPAHLFLF